MSILFFPLFALNRFFKKVKIWGTDIDQPVTPPVRVKKIAGQKNKKIKLNNQTEKTKNKKTKINIKIHFFMIFIYFFVNIVKSPEKLDFLPI